MANPVTRNVLRYKSAGNVQVFPKLPTEIVGGQDGLDLGTGGPALAQTETASQAGTFAHNRVVEFLNDRLALAANGGVADAWGIYKKNYPGANQWGKVIPSSAFLTVQGGCSGLHVLHPAGVPTVIFFGRRNFSTALFRYDSTDGVTWVLTHIAQGTSPSTWGQSIVYRSSVFFSTNHVTIGASGAIRAYDLATTALTTYDVSALFNSSQTASGYALHIVAGVMFLFGWSSTGPPWRGRLVKLVAGVFTHVYEDTVQGALDTTTNGHSALYTDPTTGDLVLIMTEETSGVPGVKIVSFNDPNGAATPTTRTASMFGGTFGADKYLPGGGVAHRHRRFSVFVDTQTTPGSPTTFITTWIPGGNTETWEHLGLTVEVQPVSGLAGISDDYALPYDTVGGGERSPAISHVGIEGVPIEVGGGTQYTFRGNGISAAGTLTFRGTDSEGTPSTVVPIVPASFVVGAGLLTDLEAYYHLNGDTVDASGNGRDQAITGAGGVTFAAAKIGDGAVFANNAGRLEMATAAWNNLGLNGESWTISFWLNPTTLVGGLASSSDFASNGWGIVLLGTGALRVSQNATAADTPPATLGTGTWQHVVIVSNGTTAWGGDGNRLVYVDNVLVDTQAALSSPGSANPFTIGTGNAGANPYVGLMDEFALYKGRALTVDEVGYVYNSGAGYLLEGPTPFAVTPSIVGDTIINVVPDNGFTPYTVILDIDAPGVDVSEGEVALIIPGLV